ncbi:MULTISPECIES: flavin reductase family protein [Brucella]|jgi:flavin reductase (DIM6/NTAB) family NADH-FMN oxidoreductase RutF|uniref:Flavin reductase n=3 Tax=Brucella TaxID=234 RepID=A0AB34DTM0_9HYPH|nr:MULTISPECIES: flavin reductase family protein [Brucella/Ochrobactrum group]MCR5941313.1 flavin reductase [Ochrobactrum sp. XJ1]QOD66740.1 flavin reductase [Ochrobactrum sp. MT180101]RNL47605.1 flavin reductase [Ochrobactrum sp. MH181795]EXL05238.1 flavin oxidoreductase [Brucella anthropi]KAB2704966.1 flavin reductase [Brucella lupini]
MMNRNVLHIDRDAIGAVSKREFADAMSRMAATVSVLTSCDAGEAHGRTVTAVLSLSAEPPMVLVSVKSDSALATAILSDGGFSLAMLAEGQEMIGDAFAGKVPPAQRFLIGVWGEWPSGRPRLFGASAAIDCELAGNVPMADHTLFAGLVTNTDLPLHSRPLLWARRNYRALRHDADL